MENPQIGGDNLTAYVHNLEVNVGINRRTISDATQNICDELQTAEDIVKAIRDGQQSSDIIMTEARKAAEIIDGTAGDFKSIWQSWLRLRSIATRLTYPPEVPIINICPFCGNDPDVIWGDAPSFVWDGEARSERIYFVACSCGARTAIYDDPSVAANMWNAGLHSCPARHLFPKIRGTDDIIRTSAFMNPRDSVKG